MSDTITYTFKVATDSTVNGHVFESHEEFVDFMDRLSELATEAPTPEPAESITADEYSMVLHILDQSGKKGANMADVERGLGKTLTNKAKFNIKAMLASTDNVHAVGSARTYINRWVSSETCPREGKRNPWGHSCCHEDGFYVEPTI